MTNLEKEVTKCQLCGSKEASKSFFDSAGERYDMPIIKFSFKTVCSSCWNALCLAKSDLTDISVQYHREYNEHKNYKDFLNKNALMDDNRFYKSNPIFRNGVAVRVGDRRKEIERLCKHK